MDEDHISLTTSEAFDLAAVLVDAVDALEANGETRLADDLREWTTTLVARYLGDGGDT